MRNKIINGSLKVVEWGMKALPRWIINFSVAPLFAVACLGMGRVKRICVKNMQAVYGKSKSEAEYTGMANQHIKSIGYSMLDLLYYVDRPQELAKIVSIEHEEYLKKALALGRGVIGVTAHMGNFPLMFVSLSQRGYKVNVIIRPMRDPVFSEFMFQQCSKWNINMIQTLPKKQFLKESLGALKRNELLFILFDEVVAPKDGVKVPFFNQEVFRATGPLLFLKRSAAPILPIFVIKNEQRNYQIFIENLFNIKEGGDDEENTIKNIAGLTKVIESFVAKYPLQWGGWLNKRWANI